jgi:hypothetical protein
MINLKSVASLKVLIVSQSTTLSETKKFPESYTEERLA